ncbi:ABC transporter permease subunit [Oscillibacter sp.]|uniref:ABC transporter permease subunit n=1 Tax=Oscillibacter sp. TaxID=1945593 RepID=UPI0028B188F8|nr:ABC transporter permease subunit [Oscillibacter sp.]
MNKLMTANFARLKKNKVFWISMAFMFAAGASSVIMKLINDPTATADQQILIFPVYIGIVSAAFCSLYIGTEYSDGTIRNKLIVGHARSAVYLSNFITCSAAGIAMCLSYVAAVAVLGLPLLGLSQMRMEVLAALILVAFMMVIATTALLTLLCMLNQNKATAAVICILSIVALLVLATMINAKLAAPQYFDSYVFTDSLDGAMTGQLVNPRYLTGTKREIYQFLLDFLPTGQAVEISMQSTPHLWLMPLYSLVITLVSTGCGLICFRKKDLK